MKYIYNIIYMYTENLFTRREDELNGRRAQHYRGRRSTRSHCGLPSLSAVPLSPARFHVHRPLLRLPTTDRTYDPPRTPTTNAADDFLSAMAQRDPTTTCRRCAASPYKKIHAHTHARARIDTQTHAHAHTYTRIHGERAL